MKCWYGRNLVPIGRKELKECLSVMYSLYLNEQKDDPGLSSSLEKKTRSNTSHAAGVIRLHFHEGVTDKQVSTMSTVLRCAEKAQIQKDEFLNFVDRNNGIAGVCKLWEKIR